MNNKDSRTAIIIGGVIFIIIGMALCAWNVYVQSSYNKVEATITATRDGRNRRKAYVKYEFEGKEYTDVGLSYYNGFTMKNGKKYTVYINQKKPNEPHTVSYIFNIIIATMGGLAIFSVIRTRYQTYI